jgi:translation initiation factor 2-alpha kinase 4
LKAFQKLKTIFEGTDYFEKAAPAIAHLNEVIEYMKRLEVHSKVFINPLGSLKEKFYKGGMLFSCVYDSKQRDVFAAGGRYDSLIREYRPRMGSQSEDRHAVGFSLAWEKLSTSMARFHKSSSKSFLKKIDDEISGPWTTKRVGYSCYFPSYLLILTESSATCLYPALMPQSFAAQEPRSSKISGHMI